MSKIIPMDEYTLQWRYSLTDYPSEAIEYFRSFYGDTESSLKYLDCPATEVECQLAVLAYLSMFQRYQSDFCFESIQREIARDVLIFIRNLLLPFEGMNISDEAAMVFWFHLREFGIIGNAFNRTQEHFMGKYDDNNNKNKKAQ